MRLDSVRTIFFAKIFHIAGFKSMEDIDDGVVLKPGPIITPAIRWRPSVPGSFSFSRHELSLGRYASRPVLRASFLDWRGAFQSP